MNYSYEGGVGGIVGTKRGLYDGEIEDKSEKKKLREKNRRSEVNDKLKELSQLLDFSESSLEFRTVPTEIEKTSSQKSDIICKAIRIIHDLLHENSSLKEQVKNLNYIMNTSSPTSSLSSDSTTPLQTTTPLLQVQPTIPPFNIDYILQMNNLLQLQCLQLQQQQQLQQFNSNITIPPCNYINNILQPQQPSVNTHFMHTNMNTPATSTSYPDIYTYNNTQLSNLQFQQDIQNQPQYQLQLQQISCNGNNMSACNNSNLTTNNNDTTTTACIISNKTNHHHYNFNEHENENENETVHNDYTHNDIILTADSNKLYALNKHEDDFLNDVEFESVFSPFNSLSDCSEELPPPTHAECA